ncbi:hypothetical protein B0H15DRAFT_927397 [Mycena belliarum]|uniref:Stress-response A/B barrel domain-containing protein n=1 Tax=Mycena belliarum TaxID=1033014 RepID=A0AAD6Y0C7_9AGAR|nr:hypothetical protein B0H15DRAFT_927397 [Mycena belliae]
MAVHLFVLAKFRPSTPPAAKAAALRTARALLAAAPALPGICIARAAAGPPLDARGGRGYEFGLTVEFADRAAYMAYIPHPHHLLVAAFVAGFSDGTPLCYQIDTDGDGEVGMGMGMGTGAGTGAGAGRAKVERETLSKL